MTPPRPDHAREVRNALHDPRKLCRGLDLLKGSEEQAGGGMTVLCPKHREKSPSCSVTRGEDGTIRVRCFGCGWSGDALTLIAEVRGWSLQAQFRDVLAEGAELAGNAALAEEIRGGAARPDAAPRPHVEPPPPEKQREFPDRDQLVAMWDAARPVTEDPVVAEYLRKRAIDPDMVTQLRLARALDPVTPLPRWARYRGKAEHARTWLETGHRLIVRMWDARGILRSVRSWRVVDDESPKRLPPSGHRSTGVVLANRGAVELLTGRDQSPCRLVVVEGEPDWLTIATRTRAPVLGLISGSWSPEIAKRIPVGSEVVVRTHHDHAGDKYAREVIDSLRDRVALWRSQAA